MTTSYSGTQSVVRALRLLKLFGGDKAEWSLNELVDAAGLNKSTVFRMLTALESEGLLERTQHGDYQLGPEIVALGGRAMLNNDLIQVARPILEDLVEATGERTTLEQLVTNPDGSYSMLVLAEIQGKFLISINQYTGSRLPLHATSTGKAMLAFMPEEERDIALQQSFDTLTAKTIVNTKKLDAELQRIREQGYATAVGELEVGLMAAGTVVYNYGGDPIASISIEGPDSRISEERLHELARELVEAARVISTRLGYRG